MVKDGVSFEGDAKMNELSEKISTGKIELYLSNINTGKC